VFQGPDIFINNVLDGSQSQVLNLLVYCIAPVSQYSWEVIIDHTPLNSLHGDLNCKLGGLDCSVII